MKVRRVLVVLVGASSIASGMAPSSPPAAASASEPARFEPAGMSEPVYRGHELRSAEVTIRATDGVELVGTVSWRGDGAGEPAGSRPIILIPTPYDQPASEADAHPLYRLMAEFLTEREYVVVVAAARGTGRSAGCADLVGPRTVADVVTWVEHLAAQSWSNGKVGGFGISYPAAILKAALDEVPTSFRTAVVISAGSSMYDYVAHDGVPYWTAGAVTFGTSTASHAVPDERRRRVDPQRYSCTAATRGTVDISGDMTPFLRDRDFRRGLEDVQASVLHVTGIREEGPQRMAWDDWFDELPTFRRGVIGQWTHEDTATRPDIVAMLHAWYDHELLDHPTGIGRWPVLQVQDEKGAWRAVRSYAGLAAGHGEYGLGADGTLALGPVAAKGERSWSEIQPSALDAAGAPVLPEPTPPLAAAGFGGVSFISDPLPASHLSGVAELHAHILIEGADDAHFTIELDELRPNLPARRLVVGALSAPHRTSLRDPQPVRPGRWVRYRIRTLPFEAHVDEGSSLRLRVSSADDWFVPAGSRYRATIRLDGSAVLRVPVADDSCGIVIGTTSSEDTKPCPGGVPSDGNTAETFGL